MVIIALFYVKVVYLHRIILFTHLLGVMSKTGM